MDRTWAPTENPSATVVPGKMRSDREEVPGGFSKADADKAETMEARTRSQTTAFAAPGCQVYWPSPYEVCGAIKDKYNSLGGPNSFLLWPTSNEILNPDGVGAHSTFTNGPIYWSSWGGAHPVANHFFAAWQRHGWEAGYLGYPLTDEIPAANGGLRQEFDGAGIYWHLNEAYAIGGAIRDKWNIVGAEGGPLGYPSSDELSVAKYNGRYNNFENGTVTWSGQTGSLLLYGAIRDRWAQLGREDGALGYPLADEQAAGIAHFADFENKSTIWWTALTGAHDVPEFVIAPWRTAGAQDGDLGYPVTGPLTPAQNTAGITLQQVFQNGIVSLIGAERALIGTYDPTPDPFPEPDPPQQTQRAPQANTWPPPDVPSDYPTDEVVGGATNPAHPDYGEMQIRQGFYSGAWGLGFGQDKAEHKHQLRLVESIEFLLESRFYGPRSDPLLPGTDFWGRAMDLFCHTGWGGQECEEQQYRIAHAIYDPTNYETYHEAPGPFEPIGLVTAYCGGGNTPLSGTAICDSWVDSAFMNPVN
ncbi:LGFP repeat-containing protein [Nocardia fluminea]|uniref:LGFP repeat-containing protein n=2 Tax=Nocardia fluminea TaxID=134984 RepID=A0A2N3VHG4_9NOCA|nr:LGFP repeat-containing protein [Nocardia fluminea]